MRTAYGKPCGADLSPTHLRSGIRDDRSLGMIWVSPLDLGMRPLDKWVKIAKIAGIAKIAEIENLTLVMRLGMVELSPLDLGMRGIG
jgi:hypothetical protein